jgi:hypothetical protein
MRTSIGHVQRGMNHFNGGRLHPPGLLVPVMVLYPVHQIDVWPHFVATRFGVRSKYMD